MKKNIYIALFMLLTFAVNAKIEILDRVAIIVEDGVVLESQVKKMMGNIVKRYEEQGAPLPPKEILRDQLIKLSKKIKGYIKEKKDESNWRRYGDMDRHR